MEEEAHKTSTKLHSSPTQVYVAANPNVPVPEGSTTTIDLLRLRLTTVNQLWSAGFNAETAYKKSPKLVSDDDDDVVVVVFLL